MTDNPDTTLDMDLEPIRSAGLALGEMIGRARAATITFERAVKEAARNELRWAGTCNCLPEDEEPVVDLTLPPDHPLAKRIKAFQDLGASLSAALKPKTADDPGRQVDADETPSEPTNRCGFCSEAISFRDDAWKHEHGPKDHSAHPANLEAPPKP